MKNSTHDGTFLQPENKEQRKDLFVISSGGNGLSFQVLGREVNFIMSDVVWRFRTIRK